MRLPVTSTKAFVAHQELMDLGSNLFQSQESENDPDSPEVFSVTQRAREHGIDVTWGDSPTRQQNKKTIQREKHKPNKDSTPTSTIVRPKSLFTNRPKQLFKPSIVQTPPKTGIYKFMDGVRSIFPDGSSSCPKRLSPKTSTPRTATSTSERKNVHTEGDANMANLLNETSDSVSWSETKSCKDLKLHRDTKQDPDVLSLSLQNEFLNDSEFDLELIKTSQEVEEKLLQQEQSTANVPKNLNSIYNFYEQDSFDDLFASKELDQLIAQSQQMDAQPRKANLLSLERHKSMPTGRTRTPLKRRFVD